MLANSEPEKKSPLKNPLVYSSILLAVVLIYVGWIFYSRWQENSNIQRRAEEQRAEKQRESDRDALEQLGGKELAIQMFYAAPTSIHRGESLQLCYGVANAKSVKLEPQDNPVWPSHSRCVDVSPTKSTTYTLTIDDGQGHTQMQAVDVKVQ